MTFHEATKSLAKQLDPKGDLIPVKSIIDQYHFKVFHLVSGKRRTQWWQTPVFDKTEYRIENVLLSGHQGLKQDVEHSDLFTITDQVDGNLQGDISAPLSQTSVEVSGIASTSHTRSVKLKKTQVSPQFLDSGKKMKMDMEHEFIKQSRIFQRNIYMITEVVETAEETKFEESNKAEGSIFYKAYVKMSLKGSGRRKKAVTIPKDCSLAFRTKKLLLENTSLCFSHFPSNKTGTFDGIPYAQSFDHVPLPTDGQRGKVMQKDIFDPKPQLGSPTNLTALQKEARKQTALLKDLFAELHDVFLCAFLAIMKENNLLQELMLQLEQALEGNGQVKFKDKKSEVQRMIENLQDSKGNLITELGEAVFYFLQALDELSELQLEILVESMEKRIVPKQLALVEKILENDFSEKDKHFIVDGQQLTEEDLTATGAMIEMSGMKLQRKESSLTGTGHPVAFSALSALYVALYVLNLLCLDK